MDLAKIKGVIFDLDGVLTDTEGLHYLAWTRVLKPLGINFSKEEFCSFAGKQIDITAEELIKKYNLPITKGKLVLQRRKSAVEIFKNSAVKLMPYAAKAVNYLARKNEIKLGLASGGIKKIVAVKLKKANLYTFFPTVVAGDEVKIGKPYPDIYLLAAKKLKLKPRECLALEDTQYGVESAKSAGLFCFAIPGEYSIKQDFSKADKTFLSLKKVVEFFKKNEKYSLLS